MEEKQFAAIIDRLDKILKLLARQAVQGMTREQDKIEALDSLDFRPGEIAKMLNKSPENVSVVLGIIRKKKQPKASNEQTTGTTATTTSEVKT